jgi:hypothetical protein
MPRNGVRESAEKKAIFSAVSPEIPHIASNDKLELRYKAF